MRHNNYVLATAALIFAVLTLVLPSCQSTGMRIDAEGRAAEADALAISADTRAAINELEQAQTDAANALNDLRKAQDAAEFLPEGQDKQDVLSPILSAEGNVTKNIQHTDKALTSLADVPAKSDGIAESAKDIQDLADKVDSDSGFFGGLSSVLRTILVIVCVLSFCALLFLGQSYGLHKITDPIISVITFPFRWVIDTLERKWTGPAKLAKEVVSGATSPKEFIAALRGAFPALDRHMKEQQ